jgi:hypothetical protein
VSNVAVAEQNELTEVDDYLLHPPEFDPAVQNAVVIVGAGPNTEHLYEAGALPELMRTRPVFVFEEGEPRIPTPDGQLINTRFQAGDPQTEALMRSGGVHSMYLSVPPGAHLPLILYGLELAGEGFINRIVVPKPLVTSEEEARVVALAVRQAESRRRELGIPMPRVGDEDKSFLYIHEHYQRKASWYEFRKQLAEVSNRLGRLQSVSIGIEEAVTIEEEGRQRAFAGGALEDLGPHVTSDVFDVAYAINEGGRYSVSNQSETWVERFRYEGSELPEDVATGFIVHGTSPIVDNERGERHEVEFTLLGGKGVSNRKEAVLTFVDPETGEESTVTVDLKKNRIIIPPELDDKIGDLFPQTEFTENGYGPITLTGLNGGDPDLSFQHPSQARIATKWVAELTRQAQRSEMIEHPVGMSLWGLERFRQLSPHVGNAALAAVGAEEYLRLHLARQQASDSLH